VFVAVISLMLLGALAYVTVGAAERFVMRWTE